MIDLPLQVTMMMGDTIMKIAPITIILALAFSVLEHHWACNPSMMPWWRKSELVTDLCSRTDVSSQPNYAGIRRGGAFAKRPVFFAVLS